MNRIAIKNNLHTAVKSWLDVLYKDLLAKFGLETYKERIKTNNFPPDYNGLNMNNFEQKTILFDYLHSYLEDLNNSIIVSGGCITSLYLNEDVNDYDLYFTNREVANVLLDYYIDVFNKHNDTTWCWSNKFNVIYKKDDKNVINDNLTKEEFFNGVETVNAISAHNICDDNKKYMPICITPNAITLTDKIQLVTRFTGMPEEILSNFDFIHTNNYYNFHENTVVTNEKAIESILTKQLYYSGSKYPICSLIRTRKFINRGWFISAGEYLKIAFQIQKLDLYDLDTLRDQLIGVDAKYFIEFLNQLEKYDSLHNVDIFKLLDNVFEEVGE